MRLRIRPWPTRRPSFEGQDQTGPTEDDDDTTGGVQDNIVVSRSVAENTAVGSAIGDPITATDGDGDVLIYTLDWSPDLRTGAGTAASRPVAMRGSALTGRRASSRLRSR